jgi:Family of unknown function (DUF6084)
MSHLDFAIVGADLEPYAAQPTLLLRVRLTETSGAPVHAVALRCQLKIEPQRRHYSDTEVARLYELFGETPQWGDSLRPFLWTHIGMTVPGFDGTTDIELPVVCTYDFEVAAAKYLHALDGGDIPIVALFSGTVFSKGGAGFVAEPISWQADASYPLPVATWRAVMDRYFPDSGWVRVSRTTLDHLQRFKATRALRGWDETFERLLKEAGVDDS